MSAELCRASSFFPHKIVTCLFRAVIAGIGLLPLQLMAGTPPSIVTEPTSLVVTQGNSASFSVSATGDAPLAYQWRFGGGPLTNATNSIFSVASAQLTDAGNYDVVVTNSSGTATSTVARLTVRSTNGPVYAVPDGGWTYIYAGSAVAGGLSAALDGTWNHLNGDDAWGGDGRSVGNGPAGGLSTTNGIVTIEDAVTSGTSGNDNRRFYFTHNISADAGVTNANTLLSDGVTLSFRARLTPATDPLIELTNAPNGFVNVNDGKGMFGIRQAESSGMLISFSLSKAIEDTGPTTSFTFASAGLHMNNLNGDVRSANVDPGEGGTINVLALDPTAFHEFWINIQDNGAAAGTHRVSIYMDASLTPTVFNVTAGTGSEGSTFTNYMAMGLPSTPQRGAFDVDFFAYRAGVVTPIGLDAPPGIVQQPANTTVAEGLSASFNVGVTGTPQFAFQWFKNGTLIPNATNRSYTTPAVTPMDNCAQFVAVVSNDNGSVTSSPPATLTVIPDTVPPSLLSAGSLDGQKIGICFSERVTPASAQNPANYSINGGAVLVNGATLRTNDGGQTAVLNVSGLSNTAGTPFTVVASNIRDLSAAGNPGGGTASGTVLGLTASDVGIGGTDPIVTGSTFSCASNQLEIFAGGSDIGGSSDGFHYVYQRRTGNFDVIVRAARLDATDRASKAGLIAREDLTAGGREVSVYVTPSSTTLAADGTGAGLDLYEADYRTVTAGATAEWPGGAEKAGVPYPNGWMRLMRAGNVFTAYHGTNGTDWVQLGQLTNVLPSALYVGAGVSAHTNAADRATTALMQDFQFVLPPQIVSQPQTQVVTNGDSVQFSVVASGAGTLRYQWHLNGVDISGATNGTLIIASAHSTDAGTYQVTVSNSAGGTDSATAALTVRLFDYGDAPDSYATLRASNGARHLVTPGVYLGAAVDIDLDGMPSSAADGDDTSGIDDEDGVGFLSPMLAGQPASIEVVASTNGLLNGWIDWNGNGTWADAGEQVFTNQPVQAGTNVLQVAVSRQATAVPTFARFRFSSGILTSFNGPAADGEVEDYAVNITPQVELSIGVLPSANPTAVSSNLVMTLNVSNAGPSRAASVTVSNQVQGAVNFGAVTSSRGSCARTGNIVNCTLGAMQEAELATIQITVVPQASGQITNQAQVTTVETDVVPENNTATATVLVEVPPSITTQPISQTVTQGDNVTFTAATQGTAPISYQWWLNGALLSGAQSTTLSLTNAQPSHAGDYTFQASNRVGSELSQAAHLTVLVPPGIAQQPQSVTSYAGRTVALSVTASGSTPFDYQWYFNTNNVLSGATNSTLLLTNAQKNQSGNYLVTIHNSAGAITSSVATVTIVEADFGDAPDSYGTTLGNNGARHRLAPGIRLGALIDFEGDGQPQSAALGDDLNGSSDEDGIIFSDPLYAGQSATVRVIASTNGILNAWLDMQANGNWTDAGDQIFTNQTLVTGTNVLVFTIRTNAVMGATFARFRFSTIAGLTPFGEAPDGEVEDYQVTILPASDLIVTGLAHPAAVPTGSDLAFGVIVSNRGPSTAHSVVLTDTLPANAGFGSATISAGSCSQNSGVLSCNVGDLASGAAITLNVVVHPLAAGAYTNSASSAASEYDPIASNNLLPDVQLVQQPPVITGQPQSLTATNGDNVSLSVQATGSSLLYQWRFNDSDLAGATNAALLLNNVQLSQTGNYVVRVSNFVGQVTSDPATITVIVPLRITSQPQNTTVIAGNTATLSVVVTGSGPVAYQWFFEGTPVVNGTNATLRIDNAQPRDSGHYFVSANNSIGAVMSDPAMLTVIVPPSIIVQPQDQTNLAGGDAVLTVTPSGTLPLSYQWYRDSSAVPFGTTESLTIPNVQKSDSAVYRVVVTNQGGAVTSAPAALVVREMDFGDAPDLGYPTLLAFNGARHVILPGVHLGTRIDFEPDGQPNADSTGDDLSGSDEDGVTFVTPLYIGEVAWVRVVASTNGYLDAWVDFNQDGAWVDAIEQVFASRPLAAGTNVLSFPIPVTAVTGTTFARFRFSTAGGLSYDGEAADGEVEDYKVQLLPAVELELKVTESPDPVWVGNTITYSLAVTNYGPLTATSVALQDSLSPIVSFVSANPSQGSCSNSGPVVICDLGALANGDWATVDLTVQPITSGMVTNYARVSSAEYDLNPTNSVDWRLTPALVNPPPFANGSRIDVNDGGTALLYPSTIFVSGVTATVYKVTVTLNNLTHSAPDDFDILLVGPGGQGVMLMSDVGGRALLSGLTIIFDDFASLVLPDNSSFISQTYKPTNYGEQDDPFPAPAPPGPYTNKLSVFRGINPNGAWSLYVVDDSVGDAGFIGDGWSLQFSTIDPIADVGVQIPDSPHNVIVGSNLTYSVIATNSGPGWASDLRVHDSLPTNVMFVSAFSPSGSCSNVAGEVDCTAGQIAPGGYATITVVASPQQLGTVSNYVAVSCNERDFNVANNTAGAISFSKLPVDLVLLGGPVPDPVAFGQNVSYTLTVSNRGPNGATSVVLSDTLPAGTAFVSAIAPGGSCSEASGVVSCQLPDLAVGATTSVGITMTPGSIGRITNAPTVTTDEVDLTPADNRLAQPTTVALVSNFDNSPQIAIASNGPATPYPASISVSGLTSAVYVVSATVSNIQHASPDDLDLLLVSPSGQAVLLMSDAGGNTSVSGVTLQFDDWAGTAVPDAGPLLSGTFRPANYITGNEVFTSPAPAGPYPTNLASLRNTNPNGTWSLFVSDHRTAHGSSSIAGWSLTIGTVDPIADLLLIGDARPNPVAVGSNLVVTLTVSNRGPAVASGIVLSNQIAPTTPLVSAMATQGSCAVNDGFVVCALSNLVAGGSSAVTLLLTPDTAGTIAHTATLVGQQLDLVPVNNALLQSVTVQLPPVVTAQPVTIVRTNGDTAQFTIVATGTDPLLYQWRRNGVNLASATNSSLTLPNVSLPDAGSYDVRVSNRVGTTLSTPASLTVKIRPVIAAIAPQATDEDTARTVPITIGDAETPAGALQLSAHSSDQSLLPDTGVSFSGSGSNRFLTLLPATNQFGGTTVTVTVTDSDGLSASTSFVLSVASVNDLPVISAIANQVTDEDIPKVLSFTVTDVETTAAALIVTGSSSDTNLVPTSRLSFGDSGANRTVTISPAPDQFGSATITLVVDDGTGGTGSTSFVLTVNSVNDPPTLDPIADQVTDEDVARTVALRIGDVDSSIANLSLEGSSSNTNLLPNENISFSGSGTNRLVTILPATNQFGTGGITLTVADTDGGSVSTTFLLVVNPANDPPTLDAVANVVMDEDSGPRTVNLSGITSGAPNETQVLNVSATSSDPTVIPNPTVSYFSPETTGALTFNPATNANGVVTITVTVNDGGASNNVLSRTFQVTVNPVNDPPTISSIVDQTIRRNETLGPIVFTVSDLETAASDLTVSTFSSNSTLVSTSGIVLSGSDANRSLSVTPETNQMGTALIQLVVTDLNGASATNQFLLTVTSPAVAPRILRLIAGPSTNSVVITSVAGLSYTLEATDSLSDLNWGTVQTQPGTGSELTLQDAAPAQTTRFYRIRVQ